LACALSNLEFVAPTCPGGVHMPTSYCKRCAGDEWCGNCYAVKRGRRAPGKADDSPPHFCAPHLSQVPAAPDPDPSTHPPPPHVLVSPETWGGLYPHLVWHVCSVWDQDGLFRLTSTLMVFSERGQLKLCLHDRERELVAFYTVPDLFFGLNRIERDLAEGSVHWRKKKKIPPVNS
jgi:hypothetical protein